MSYEGGRAERWLLNAIDDTLHLDYPVVGFTDHREVGTPTCALAHEREAS